MGDTLELFSPATRAWFAGAFAAPTPAQQQAWAAIARGDHTLVVAPTGSGKTLAAFLWAIDRLHREDEDGGASGAGARAEREPGVRVLYVSPLKALAVDVDRNLRAPLAGIAARGRADGDEPPPVRIGLRTGDTPQEERRQQVKHPPDILITTPESLFLLLTSRARETLRTVETVIVDEVHAVVPTKRGSHLALSLERLDALLPTPAQRIGLSATVNPIDEVAAFLGGPAPVTVVAPPSEKRIDLTITVPVDDMTDLRGPRAEEASPTGSAFGATKPDTPSIWPHIEREVLELIDRHRSTIVFVNARRAAERLTARLNELDAERLDAAEELGAGGPRDASAGGTSDGVVLRDVTEHIRLRLAERAAAREAAGPDAEAPPLARAHHGSVSKEQRAEIEDQLKSGRLRCVVATSSLELGIDMGEVDLVVQVEAPPSTASGLQRVGRAGHSVGDASRGVIIPKHRADLLHATVVADRMARGELEPIRAPRHPLDVLAQQVVAAVSVDTLDVDELFAVVRRAAPFATLPRSAYDATLDLLAGRYPSDEFAELRPRIVWDRVAGQLTARPGAQRLAVTSGGTIPDRGLFGVFLVGEKASRVGELDEEMVYESRVGDVFALGATSWRIEDITHDRVLVSPAPGQPGRLPFWKGDAIGRPAELGRAVGGFVRELSRLDGEAATDRAQEAGLDAWAAGNLVRFLSEQREATGHLPTDKTLLVERFRDELGDWRIVLHSPYGAQVHAPWALAVGVRLRELYGLDAQAVSGDDGIVLRVPETDVDPPGADIFVLEPDEVEELVTTEVGSSALFASRFRECAARALLLPRRHPGRRSPLWQQRQRSAQLLDVASKYGSFPIVLETIRECLQDVYDVPALTELMRDVSARRTRVVEVATPEPSPFARTLLFGYVAAFMYEGDSPLAEKRAAALSLDSSLLAELLGRAELRELLDPEVLVQTEAELQRLTDDRRATDLEAAADMLRLLGPLTTDEVSERSAPDAPVARWLEDLEARRRVVRVRIVGQEQWAAVEDIGRLRDALGVPVPVGTPEAFAEEVGDPLGDLVGRFARTHGPFLPQQVATRLGLGVAVVHDTLQRLAAAGRVVEGEFRPGGQGTEWCDSEVLRRLRRRSLAALRKEVEPVEPRTVGRFLPAWQQVGGRLRGVDGVLSVVEQLAGCAVPASALEPFVLGSRVSDYSPAMLDELTASGEVLWSGMGALPGTDGWVALHVADSAHLTLPDVAEADNTPLHDAILEALRGGGAFFFRQLSDAVGATDDQAVTEALWDLVWSGQVSNDTLAPLRTLVSGGRSAHRPRRGPPRSRTHGRRSYSTGRPAMPSRTGPPTAAGRWSLLPAREADPTRRAHAAAESLLERHGVATRGAVISERVPGGFAGVYRVLAAFEESGRCRRGYFIQGLGAAQFGAVGAVDRLRAMAGEAAAESPRALALAACDPANPYGAALPWPERPDETGGAHAGGTGHRPGRKAGALVVLVDGALVLYVERGGRTLLTFSADEESLQPAVDALALAVREGALGRLTVERADGEHILGSALARTLEAAGFHATPRGLRLRG